MSDDKKVQERIRRIKEQFKEDNKRHYPTHSLVKYLNDDLFKQNELIIELLQENLERMETLKKKIDKVQEHIESQS